MPHAHFPARYGHCGLKPPVPAPFRVWADLWRSASWLASVPAGGLLPGGSSVHEPHKNRTRAAQEIINPSEPPRSGRGVKRSQIGSVSIGQWASRPRLCPTVTPSGVPSKLGSFARVELSQLSSSRCGNVYRRTQCRLGQAAWPPRRCAVVRQNWCCSSAIKSLGQTVLVPPPGLLSGTAFTQAPQGMTGARPDYVGRRMPPSSSV